MKKTLMTIGFLSILTTSASASLFASLSYGQSLGDNSLSDNNGNTINFKNAKSFELKVGSNNFPVEEQYYNFGFYLGLEGELGSDSTTHMYNGHIEKFEYATSIWSAGLTYGLNNNIVLFGGAGQAVSQAKATISGKTEEDYYFKDTELNLNGGAIIYLLETQVGIIIEYDSVPHAVNVGLSMRF